MIARLALASVMTLSLAGCVTDFLGRTAGREVGERIGQAIPTPPAAVVVEPRGGTFCEVMDGLGWMDAAFAQAEIDALTDDTYGLVRDTLEWGEDNCGWGAVP